MPGVTSISGRLREVDFEHRTAALYDAEGSVVTIYFEHAQDAEVRSAANRTVRATGVLEDRGDDRSMTLQRFEVQGVSDEFWRHRTVEELIAEQGIRPLGKRRPRRASFWPPDLEPDAFIAMIDDASVADESAR